MRVLTALLLGLALALPAFASDDDEATLRNIKLVLWPQAYRTQDTELLDRLLHDSFEMIDNEGRIATKADEIEYIRTTPWTPGEFTYDIERLEIYQGRFAIIAGTGIAETYTYKSSNYLVKEDGTWRAVASHVSGVASRDDTDD